MTSIIASRVVLIASATLAVSSCKDSTAPRADLLATTTVTPSTFRQGDSVLVRVVVINRGNESQTIDSDACPRAFVVTTADGVQVGPAGTICPADFIGATLAPGDQYTFNEWWAGDTGDPVERTHVLVAPGTYQVRGRVDGAPVDALSTRIRITP